MKSILLGVLSVLLLVLISSPSCADSDPAQAVAKQCSVEMETFCSDVTPGQGRILACLYAYSDKLSQPCQKAFRIAAEHVKLISAVTSHLKSECGDDVDRLCKDVPAGEGRLLNCLEENESNLSEKCKMALKDVGLKK